jgi:hypothetical protein
MQLSGYLAEHQGLRILATAHSHHKVEYIDQGRAPSVVDVQQMYDLQRGQSYHPVNAMVICNEHGWHSLTIPLHLMSEVAHLGHDVQRWMSERGQAQDALVQHSAFFTILGTAHDDRALDVSTVILGKSFEEPRSAAERAHHALQLLARPLATPTLLSVDALRVKVDELAQNAPELFCWQKALHKDGLLDAVTRSRAASPASLHNKVDALLATMRALGGAPTIE